MAASFLLVLVALLGFRPFFDLIEVFFTFAATAVSSGGTGDPADSLTARMSSLLTIWFCNKATRSSGQEEEEESFSLNL